MLVASHRTATLVRFEDRHDNEHEWTKYIPRVSGLYKYRIRFYGGSSFS